DLRELQRSRTPASALSALVSRQFRFSLATVQQRSCSSRRIRAQAVVEIDRGLQGCRTGITAFASRFLATSLKLITMRGRSMRCLSMILGLFIVPSIWTTSALAEKRVALVIGNSDYRHNVKLSNPKNDAVDVAASLKQLGFDVILETDLDKRGM